MTLVGLLPWHYRVARAALLTIAVYSFLLWAYLVLRIVVNHAAFDSAFIDAFLPWFTFYRLGIISFVLSASAFFLYLAAFWKGGAR